MTARLGIVIVNYRIAGLVCDCLRSLAPEAAALPGTRVRVVDNDSQDGSAERISRFIEEQGFEAWASVMAAPRNGGFSYGNNLAIQPLLEEGFEAFLLLNPDTYVRPGALQPLLDALQKDPSVGVVGSRLENPDGTPQRSMFRFPSAIGEMEWTASIGPLTWVLKPWAVSRVPPDLPAFCDWVAGASMLVRREVFEKIGLLDEKYFLYFEEVDFCLRAAHAGWRCRYEPLSRVVHLVGQSTGVSYAPTERRRLPRYWFESRRRFFVKNFGALYAAAADLFWMTGRVLGYTRGALQRRPDRTPHRFLRDFARESVFARGPKI
jgi:GT2 family glycosyltransferase